MSAFRHNDARIDSSWSGSTRILTIRDLPGSATIGVEPWIFPVRPAGLRIHIRLQHLREMDHHNRFAKRKLAFREPSSCIPRGPRPVLPGAADTMGMYHVFPIESGRELRSLALGQNRSWERPRLDR